MLSGLKSPSLSRAVHQTYSLCHQLCVFPHKDANFFQLFCRALAAEVLVLQGGHGLGQTQGGKSRRAKQTLAKTDNLLDILLIPVGC